MRIEIKSGMKRKRYDGMRQPGNSVIALRSIPAFIFGKCLALNIGLVIQYHMIV